jgi:hypothetical protein
MRIYKMALVSRTSKQGWEDVVFMRLPYDEDTGKLDLEGRTIEYRSTEYFFGAQNEESLLRDMEERLEAAKRGPILHITEGIDTVEILG